jgi:hypothetical protein
LPRLAGTGNRRVPPPPTPPPPPPPPPSRPVPPPPPGGRNRLILAREIWVTEYDLPRSQFPGHYEVFISLPVSELDLDDFLDAWREYIETWVQGEKDREEFWRSLGINPRDFDWEGWRQAMGYRSKR